MASVTKNQGRVGEQATQTTDLEETLDSANRTQQVEPTSFTPSPTTRVGLFSVGLLALFIVFGVTWGAAWAALPALIPGWASAAIMSGSMSPVIQTGDVVVAAPTDGENLGVGTVVVFDDPSGEGYITHRIVEVNEDGTYKTQGDANPGADSTPLEPDQIVGTGRILVPLIGLPFFWISTGEWLRVVFSGLVVLLALWLSRYAFIDPFKVSIRTSDPAHGSD